MNELELIPFVSVGPLRFGMPRSESRKRLGPKVKSFQKTPTAATETDLYQDQGLFLHYDSQGGLEFIEAVGPSRPTFRGVVLLGKDLQDVLDKLKALGLEGVPDESSLAFDPFGFCLYLSAEGALEGVAAWKRGYYDRPT